ncbi:Zn(II)2Cys6 transcriptional activator [Pyrenophora tritici-repentis]|nr:Zn(II)2Cys6 transcriptional activator [Pyrenophora tritici-repentis]KAI0587345.1 Zn(II)2Cys6 transcriptional activator [Pyrenophora tritici-repentis]KAI1579887.1 Zn II 2Cys6 transcriptional activator [Pyrenophora tritici-repentis]PWO25531.1 HTH-Tnp-Tc5 multi-domain protein [Pyrenophora tritici-repentis]PZD35092.1 Zn(II)2Cys6 transcriptional activator [Pyrenophora tritici-repentis]
MAISVFAVTLKCNVQQDPFISCARCQKQNLRCVIQPNFKRVGKRNRNAEMEKEMEYLRERLAMYEGQSTPNQPVLNAPQQVSDSHSHSFTPSTMPKVEDDAFLQTQHTQVAATSLLDLRSGSPMFFSLGAGEVRLGHSEINELFAEYFQLYHPFLPFLDQVRSPDEYYSQDHRLLFWAIVAVAARRYAPRPSLLKELAKPLSDLIWDSIRNQPNHHVVKALCLLCTWPLPAERTVTDPTFILCGAMMQVAMQIGLHQPTHPDDFSRTRMRLRREDIHDRLRTWAVCNIVAQTVSTGNGQPSITLYDSTLDFKIDDEEHMRIIPPTLFVRLRQEMAASRINKLLYSVNSHRFAEGAAISYMSLEADRLKEERLKEQSSSLDGVDTDLEELYHFAVSLHLHLYSFFNPEARLERRDDLVALYFAATAYLERVFKLQRDGKLPHVPYYVMQMALAAGFALLKLLNSDFASKLPADKGRRFVLQTVDALRKAKVWSNDLLDRFAEVLAQLWKESSRGRSLHSLSQSPSLNSNSGMNSMFNHHNQQQLHQQQSDRRDSTGMFEDPLGLIIRSRMSMSVLFDCAWRWREAQVNGAAEQLENTVMTNPTNPDSSTNSTPPPGVVMEGPEHTTLPNFNPQISTLSMPLPLTNGMASANSFEMFDSVSWLLDTQPDWTYGSGTFGNDFGV